MLDEPNMYGQVWTPEAIAALLVKTFSPDTRLGRSHPEGPQFTDPDKLIERDDRLEVVPFTDGQFAPAVSTRPWVRDMFHSVPAGTIGRAGTGSCGAQGEGKAASRGLPAIGDAADARRAAIAEDGGAVV